MIYLVTYHVTNQVTWGKDGLEQNRNVLVYIYTISYDFKHIVYDIVYTILYTI